MKKSSLSAARAAGLLVGLFGAAMAARWMFPLEAVAHLVPGAERMGIVQPLLFVVAGLGLVVASLPHQAPWLGHLKTACIAALVLLPAAGLLDSIASLGFLLAGIAFWLHGRPPTRAGRLGFIALSLIVCTIGLGALVGHFVGLETLYPVAGFSRMPPATAFGLSAVGAGLWMLHEASCAFDPRAVHESEQRIKRRSIAVLALVTLAGGVAGFAVMRDTFERSVSQDMLLNATTNATSLAHTIDVAAWLAKAVASRPAARDALATLSKAPQDAAARAFLQKVADSFISDDLTGVEIHAADGERIAQAGTMALPQAQVIQRLANAGPATSLAWSGGYLLVAETAVVVDGRTVGRVRTEQRLRLFDELVAHLRAAGDTSDVAICGRDLHKAVCAPNRFRPAGFETPMLDANGRPGLPVTRALLGERGVEVLKDRRGAQVLSAFAPIGNSGLGLAVRTDVDSLYAPLRSRLNILVLVLVGIVALALYAQHSQVRPVLQQLVESQQMVKAIVDDQSELVSLVKPDGELGYVNPAYARYFGHKPAEMIGRNMFDFIEPIEHETVRQAVAQVLSTGRTTTGESRIVAADGSTRWIAWTDSLQHDRAGAPMLHSVGRDVTERKEAERAVLESESRLRTVADSLPMRVAYVDANERYRFNNLAYERAFGRRREELHGRTVREVLGEAAYPAVEPHIRRVLGGEAVTFQSEMASGGSYVCYEAHYIPQFAADGKAVLGFHAVITDITRQKLEERRLVELARVDPLTGVVNRSGFELRVAEAMERSRKSGALMALMYLDIDRFKQINDRFGHDVGDELLRGFAGRLMQTLRSTDTIARLGGDEFTVIMEGLPRPDIASIVGNKIVQAMNAPFVIGAQSIDVTVSIGLAFYQGEATTMEALVKQADVMLYRAKGAGRNNVQTPLRLIEGGRA